MLSKPTDVAHGLYYARIAEYADPEERWPLWASVALVSGLSGALWLGILLGISALLGAF